MTILEREEEKGGFSTLKLAARLWRACLDFRGTRGNDAVTRAPVKTAHPNTFPISERHAPAMAYFLNFGQSQSPLQVESPSSRGAGPYTYANILIRQRSRLFIYSFIWAKMRACPDGGGELEIVEVL